MTFGLACVAAVGCLVGLLLGLLISSVMHHVTLVRAETDRTELLRAADRVSRCFANASQASIEFQHDSAQRRALDEALTRSVTDLEDASFRIRERLGLPEVDLD